MQKHIAIYVRVSTNQQTTRSQLPELQHWAEGQELPVKFYSDKATGKHLDRSGWQQIEAAMRAGKVRKIVVWRLDRLGRTASGLTKLFEDLVAAKIGLFSLRDSLDLETAAGRLMANVLASVAAYETEIRAERQLAGILAAKAQGKKWGGSKAGVRKKVTPEMERTIARMRKDGENIAAIARVMGLTRHTVYSCISSCPKDLQQS